MDPGGRPAQATIGWFLAIVAAAFIGGAASGALVSLVIADDSGSDAPTGPTSQTRVLTSEQSAITEAVDLAGPAVVTIFNELPPAQDEQGRIFETVNVGSGVIVDERGFIVTNEHVIHEPGRLKVVLPSGEERPATVVSHDAPFTDLAVLSIPAGDLKALSFGDSRNLKIGQTVIAIGSALFEYRNSVTVGVVSGLGRRYLREGVFMEDLIQTDAAINSGNSGGPLVTTSGEIVGLTTNVVRRIGSTENVVGISFAISSRTMEPIVNSIIEGGSFARPYLGIDHMDIDQESAVTNRLASDRGAIVQRVVDGSPAQAAGVRPGDIILRMERVELNEDMPFINALSRLTPRQRASIQVLRDGRPLDLMVEVAQR
jgi:2-alkenal reductase